MCCISIIKNEFNKYLQNCPPTLVFNPNTELCDYPRNVPCTQWFKQSKSLRLINLLKEFSILYSNVAGCSGGGGPTTVATQPTTTSTTTAPNPITTTTTAAPHPTTTAPSGFQCPSTNNGNGFYPIPGKF